MLPILSGRYPNLSLTKKIRAKGRDEQELQYLFPSLYGNKRVTKNTIKAYREFYSYSEGIHSRL